MTYTQQLLVLVGVSTLFMAAYFVLAMPWVMLNISYSGGGLLPFGIIIIGGAIYLARGGRNDDGDTVGYARIVLMAVAIALLSPFLAYILLASFSPFLYSLKHR
jgi:hypothetical protein